jgi:integrase
MAKKIICQNLTQNTHHVYNATHKFGGDICMKGYIGTRQKCIICGGRLVHDERRKGCFCQEHKQCAANGFYVKFGRDIYRRFQSYEAAARFLNGIRFKTDEGTFDMRDYKKDNPLGFENLSQKWLEIKASSGRRKKTVQSYTNFMNRAVAKWGNRNIKAISDGDIEDLLFDKDWTTPKDEIVKNKTRSNMKSCLHEFWSWVVRREKKNNKQTIEMPEFPEIKYELGWRNITDIETLEKILNEIRRISWDTNPKIWLGIKLLSTYIKIRPGEMRMVKERDINLEAGYILIKEPKEGTNNEGKYAFLDDEDIELIRSMPKGLPDMYFFRHQPGKKGVITGSQFGPKYFKKWWDRACKNLGVKDVGLYGGTKHTVATALGRLLSPEEIKRGGTGSKTNKAFDRYFQPQKREHVQVISAIKQLKKEARGEVVEFKKKKM